MRSAMIAQFINVRVDERSIQIRISDSDSNLRQYCGGSCRCIKFSCGCQLQTCFVSILHVESQPIAGNLLACWGLAAVAIVIATGLVSHSLWMSTSTCHLR